MPIGPLVFDHFEVLTDELGAPVRLGPGGMGTTYRAYDTRLRRNVALKLINEQLLQDPTSRLRFFNEARAAALIDHPNVARVIYLCPEDAPQYFFAMELVDGESLANRVGRHGPLSPSEALLLLRPIADALTALAEHHLVHRDIKPENIMIAKTGSLATRVKLIDFGLAKALSGAEDRFASVHTGDRFIGSVYFASPEQIHSRTALDARSDFYSLGATLWHILTGFPPFTGTVFEVQEAHVYRDPPWEKIASAPEPLRDLLRHLLAKAREERPADAAALLAAWDAAIAGLATDRATAQRPLALDDAPALNTTLAGTKLDALSPPATGSSAPLVAVAVEHVPGVVAPPAGATLVQETASGATLLVRPLPRDAAMRVEVLAAAGARVPGLLEIQEVRGEEVMLAWPRGVLLGRLLARAQGALPLPLVLGWLPGLAASFDGAAAQKLRHLGIDPARWIAIFPQLPQQDFPETQADLPPEQWGPIELRLDPLAGLDRLTAHHASASDRTIMEPAAAPLATPRDFLTAFAGAVRTLLGGVPGRLTPLSPLPEEANELLLAALQQRFEPPWAAEWSQRFAAEALGARQRAAPPAVPHKTTAPPIPPAPLPPPVPPPPAPPVLPTPGSPSRGPWLALGFCAVAVAALFVLRPLWQPRPSPVLAVVTPTPATPAPETARPTPFAPVIVATPTPPPPVVPSTPVPVKSTPVKNTPTPPPPDPRIAMRQRLIEFMRDYVANGEFHTVNDVARFFASSVDFLDEGKLDRNRVLANALDYYTRWPQQTQAIEGEPRVTIAPNGSTALVEMTIKYDVRNGPSFVRGRTADQITVDLRGPTLQITAVRSSKLESERGGPLNKTPGWRPTPAPKKPGR